MTEKDYNPEAKMKKANKAQEKMAKSKKNVGKSPVKKTEDKKEIKESSENKPEAKESKQKVTPKKAAQKKEVSVNSRDVHVSTKYAIAICKFVKNKSISKAIADLEKVMAKKKVLPMKGEIPHQKGKKIMSGKFPKRASENFIQVLKSLQGNANNHDLENPIITEAIPNKAARPVGRFGRWERKRTHITLKAKSKKESKKLNKKNKKVIK